QADALVTLAQALLQEGHQHPVPFGRPGIEGAQMCPDVDVADTRDSRTNPCHCQDLLSSVQRFPGLRPSRASPLTHTTRTNRHHPYLPTAPVLTPYRRPMVKQYRSCTASGDP